MDNFVLFTDSFMTKSQPAGRMFHARWAKSLVINESCDTSAAASMPAYSKGLSIDLASATRNADSVKLSAAAPSISQIRVEVSPMHLLKVLKEQ
jgi:hypothetical protein